MNRKSLFVFVLGLMTSNLATADDTVVLLHGLGRSSFSMLKIEKALNHAGFKTCNIDYPSRKFPIEVIVSDYVAPKIRKCVTSSEKVSFVSHSMGGIIVRQIYQTEPDINFGRAVMLGTPNHGSELVDSMRDWALFKWIAGPAGQQLGTEPSSTPNSLSPATFEVGVIAGNEPFIEPFKGRILGQSDGKVSVESTKLEGMKDFITLPVSHSLIIRNTKAIEQTITFLSTGKFTDGQLSQPSSP